jgi:hypothetical protein
LIEARSTKVPQSRQRNWGLGWTISRGFDRMENEQGKAAGGLLGGFFL